MKNAIVERELTGLLRKRRALAIQLGAALVFALLVLLRWPTDSQVDLSGAQSRDVFRLFGYGLLTTLMLLVPVFPATTVVREKMKGTLELLLNTPMSPSSIYFGKLLGQLGFALILVVMSVPAAAACYAMGGISLFEEMVLLYAVLVLLLLQYAALGLLVSSFASSTDSSVRMTYGCVLLMSVVALGPHQFFQGIPGLVPSAASLLRCVSPIPAVMEIMGDIDVASHGVTAASGATLWYVVLSAASTAAFMGLTIRRLRQRMFDRPRPTGLMTQDRSIFGRLFRRTVFLVDPQRRKPGIGPWTNPVMIKEFRARRFGRLHWMFRLVAVCALVSLLLTYAATAGTMDWGVNTIGGLMVVLQVALIVLLTPSLAAGLISAERESGGWQLLQMTPLSAGVILRGKLLSVMWTLVLILFATLPGYLVMLYIEPAMAQQVTRVLLTLLLTAVFAVLLSAAASSLFPRTSHATMTAYAALMALCAGTLIVWLERDVRFGHSTVEAALSINPMAAALNLIEAPGFETYLLVPTAWWITGCASLACFLLLSVQTWRLTKPQ